MEGGYRRRTSLTKAEQLMETPQYRRERLVALTGIENEQELFEIYYELKVLFQRIGLEHISYRRNTVDDRKGTETELAFTQLTDEEFLELSEALQKLRIFGFPETDTHSNYQSLIIEHKRDLEVLRLLSVFRDIDRARDELLRMERIKVEAAAFAERMRVIEEERIARLTAEEKAEAERRLAEEIERVKREKEEALREAFEKEDQEFKATTALLRADHSAKVDALLSSIRPQHIDIREELEDLAYIGEPFAAVTRFRGFQRILPSEKRPTRRDTDNQEAVRDFTQEVDPIAVDEALDFYTELWREGKIVDLEVEPQPIPGARVDFSIFPKRFIWKLDQKTGKKRCYEYEPATKKVGREVTKKERTEYFVELRRLREERRAHEEVQDGKPMTKSKREVELEQDIILTTNNLIAWLINDLTSQMRGNNQIRKVKENNIGDLYQSAVLGLLYAVDHFDPAKSNDGSVVPYVLSCMEGSIRKLYWKSMGVNLNPEQVRLPGHLVDMRRKYMKEENRVRRGLIGESDTSKVDAVLAERLASPEVGLLHYGGEGELQRLRNRLRALYEEIPVDILLQENGDPDDQVAALSEYLTTEPTQQDHVERLHLEREIKKALATLSPREERVLRLRFYPQSFDRHDPRAFNMYGGTDGLTYDHVAEQMGGISRERVRQIEMKALRLLRHPSRSRRLQRL